MVIDIKVKLRALPVLLTKVTGLLSNIFNASDDSLMHARDGVCLDNAHQAVNFILLCGGADVRWIIIT